MTVLARLLDRDELDAAEGPRGKMTIELPLEWLNRGETVEVAVPSRLVCARCEGGGCDACNRSGAIRIPGEQADRTTRFALPHGASENLVVRLVHPLGAEAGLAQLCIEVRVATSSLPTSGCSRVESPRTPIFVAAAVALAFALALAIAALLR